MTTDQIINALVYYLRGISSSVLEVEYDQDKVRKILSNADRSRTYQNPKGNWKELDVEKISTESLKYGHPQEASHYRLWKLEDLPGWRFHIWHDRDMVLEITVERV